MFTGDLLGLPIPDAGPVFTAALTIHVATALTAVVSGALAATAHKGSGRHPRAGRVYLWALSGTAASATIMAATRWQHDAHLFVMGALASVLGWYGYRVRRRHRPGWPLGHGVGMAGSYVVLVTAFYVDNGPFLPVWSRLPHVSYWLLPSIVGIPATWIALRRYTRRPRQMEPSAQG